MGTPESWSRNAQCRVVLSPAAIATAAVANSAGVELCISLQQPDARLCAGTPFPFEDRLHELFVCISRLDGPGQRLPAFDKKRALKPSGVSLISRRREVLLRSRLPEPGA